MEKPEWIGKEFRHSKWSTSIPREQVCWKSSILFRPWGVKLWSREDKWVEHDVKDPIWNCYEVRLIECILKKIRASYILTLWLPYQVWTIRSRSIRKSVIYVVKLKLNYKNISCSVTLNLPHLVPLRIGSPFNVSFVSIILGLTLLWRHRVIPRIYSH